MSNESDVMSLDHSNSAAVDSVVNSIREIRVQYCRRVRTVKSIGGVALVDVYFVLLIAAGQINNGSVKIEIPKNWINKAGGISEITCQQVNDLSSLLVVNEVPGNVAGRVVTGLTQEGVKFLKDHLDELAEDLSLFSLTEEQIKDVEFGGTSK